MNLKSFGVKYEYVSQKNEEKERKEIILLRIGIHYQMFVKCQLELVPNLDPQDHKFELAFQNFVYNTTTLIHDLMDFVIII
jgi:hypothetical protein